MLLSVVFSCSSVLQLKYPSRSRWDSSQCCSVAWSLPHWMHPGGLNRSFYYFYFYFYVCAQSMVRGRRRIPHGCVCSSLCYVDRFPLSFSLRSTRDKCLVYQVVCVCARLRAFVWKMSCHWPETATVSRVVRTRFLNSGGQFDLPCNLFGGAILVRVVELSSPMAIGVPRSKVCHARSGDFSDQEWLLLIFRCYLPIWQYDWFTAHAR